MTQNKNLALTFDDVFLRPKYSEILPDEADLTTKFSKNISMNIPIVSAAMDTVTEAQAAIVLAQQGGIGTIHKNLTPKHQAREIEKVKKYESGMILDPITIHPDEPLSKVAAVTARYKISGLPVIDEYNKLIGIVTNRDMRFETNLTKTVKEIMTSKNLITSQEGITLDQAKEILKEHRIEKLPVVDKDGYLKGLITIKDIEKAIAYPKSNKDSFGRLRVSAAVGVGEKEFKRAAILIEANVDALVVDTAHGHSKGVIEMVRALKADFPKIDVVAGNVATAEACQDLIKAGADAIKVGIGPGSICTTRIIAGIGVPQMSAIIDCKEICHEAKIPYIADGGIKYSGDLVKALAGGASSVMIGSLFAGTDESPGEMILYQGRSYKVYRGMGSLGAMVQGAKDRYGQGHVEDKEKLVPQGIEGQVPYRGSLSSVIYQLVGGIRAGMGYLGARTIDELREKAEFVQVSTAALKESHPHDVFITKEAPNYRISSSD